MKTFFYIENQESERYPARLKKIMGNNAPINLEMQGNRDLLKSKCVGFSGARDCSLKAEHATRDCAEQVVKNNMTVVSGGARGIDQIAHYTALEKGGSTIVVIPQGIESFTIPPNLIRVWDWGRVLVLSIFSTQSKWAIFRALERNKIIVALSFATLIIEANETGGTMHAGTYSIQTAKQPTYAIKYYDMTEHAKGNAILLEAGAKRIVKNHETNRANLTELFKESV